MGTEERPKWIEAVRRWTRTPREMLPGRPARIGLALGGGFARGIAHVGVLRVFERHQIPVHAVAGVSAGAIVAAAFASGATAEEIGRAGQGMRFTDVARWSLSRMGLAGSKRMEAFLHRLMKAHRFEDMRIPLCVVATDLGTGRPVQFRDHGDVSLPIRASCSYPGLFQPVEFEGQHLVDGAMSMEIPAGVLRRMGATRVISVALPMLRRENDHPSNMFQVVNRCFQIMQGRMEHEWRRQSDLVIEPDVCRVGWDSFQSAQQMIEAGEQAALEALPRIEAWLRRPSAVPAPLSAEPIPG
ncbi:MAG: patatin-like phospholipase family protein [Bryobacteraceae bacterium]